MNVARAAARLATAALLLTGCRGRETTSRWGMTRATGALALVVRHPLAGDAMPASGRDYVMGSAGNGQASLTVNGERVHVEPDGAFLAYLRAAPPGGDYRVVATLGGDTARALVPVAPAATALASPAVVVLAAPVNDSAPVRGDVVLVPAGNRLGPGTAEIPGRSDPEGDYTWYLLAGTRGVVEASRPGARLVRFAPSARAWIDGQFLRAASAPPRMPAPAGDVSVVADAAQTEIVVPANEPLAYEVEERDHDVIFTVHGVPDRARTRAAPVARGYVQSVSVEGAGAGVLRVHATLLGPVFGYEVAWRQRALVLRLRHPPVIDAGRPLRGLTIVVDAGHPPAGAVGPTGLAEPDVTLDVARRAATVLRARGARVVLTRTDDGAVSLEQRIATARASEAHAFVSVHADAVASGADPAADVGTAVFAHRPHSTALAGEVQRALVARLGLPDRGARHGDYAVIRQTWMPAVLCEGATMTVPAQEAALADAAFRDAYALGIADGMEGWFRALGGRLTRNRVLPQ